MQFFNRDISWLGFNFRVLQEAQKSTVPLYERIQFLSIYSSNLDEFFRVRYPVYSSLDKLAKKADEQIDTNDAKEIERIINEQLPVFGTTLRQEILPELRKQGVHLYYDEPLPTSVLPAVKSLFFDNVLAYIQPRILSIGEDTDHIENNALYLLVVLGETYALVNVPEDCVGRFVTLSNEGEHTILFLDDVVRTHVNDIFRDEKVNGVYSIKLTRSADIDIEDEWSDMFEEQVVNMIKKRERGAPARLLYERGLPEDAKKFIASYFGIGKRNIIEGGRYHNLKDLASLPNPLGANTRYMPNKGIQPRWIDEKDSIFKMLDDKDRIIHVPYHSYNSVLRFFNEAAIDPYVQEVKVTLYRVASDSLITNALISAAKNGKKVTAFVELKARFDEANNLAWAKQMKAAGVRIVYSIPGMKVHAKVALVKRKDGLQAQYYSLLSTGNFNEKTARFYTDHVLFTADKRITRDVDLLFAYLPSRKHPNAFPFLKFDNLWVAGFNFMHQLAASIDTAIANVQAGKESKIIIKLNNLQEQDAIKLLYKASNNGVKVELIVRGICCLVPGVAGQSENITVKRIVGRYLEHSRVFIFQTDEQTDAYIGSADLMNRNIHRRVEVVFPILDEQVKKEMIDITALHLQDNVQATVLDSNGTMTKVLSGDISVDSQQETYKYVSKL